MIAWQVPPSMHRWLRMVPEDRPVAVLVRHSVRPPLPPGDAGLALSITDAGRALALELGRAVGPRVRSLRSSPILRCVQTAEALREGGDIACSVETDTALGLPGVYVADDQLAAAYWKEHGHEVVMSYLVAGDGPRPGMADPAAAAAALVERMLGLPDAGLHVHVTHDSLVTATAARTLGRALTRSDWPWYLEAAFFWRTERGIAVRYRDHEATP